MRNVAHHSMSDIQSLTYATYDERVRFIWSKHDISYQSEEHYLHFEGLVDFSRHKQTELFLFQFALAAVTTFKYRIIY